MKFVKDRFQSSYEQASSEEIRLATHAHASDDALRRALAIWVDYPEEIAPDSRLFVFLYDARPGVYEAELVVVSSEGPQVGRLPLGSLMVGLDRSYKGSEGLASYDDLKWRVYKQVLDLIENWGFTRTVLSVLP